MQASRQQGLGADTRSLAVYARILGLSWGVDIRFDERLPTAMTDGKTIFLPLRQQMGSQEDAILAEGLVDHEAGVHCRQTDFELGETLLKGEPAITLAISNILEDVWGERELCALKPGCGPTIDKAIEIMLRRGVFRGPDPKSEPAAHVVNTVLMGLRTVKRGQVVLADLFKAHRDIAEASLGPELVEKVWQKACQVDQVSSTKEAINLAKEIVALIAHQAQGQSSGQEQPPPEEGDGQEQEVGKPGAQGQPSKEQESQQSDQQKPGQQPGDGGNEQSDQDKNDQPAAPSAQEAQSSSATTGQGASNQTNPSESSRTSPGDAGASQGAPKQGQDESSGPRSEQAKGPSGQPSNQPPNQAGSGQPEGKPSEQKAEPSAQEKAQAKAQEAAKKVLEANASQTGSGEFADQLSKALGAPGKAQKPTFGSGDETAGARGAGNNWDISDRDLLVEDQALTQHIGKLSRPVAIKLGNKLEDALISLVETAVDFRRSGRRIQSRILPGVITAAKTRIFRHQDEQEGIDTSVLILTDISGSMRSAFGGQMSCLEAAYACTRALGDVLDRFQVPFAVRLFGDQLTRVKSFEQSWRRHRAYITSRTEGSTCTDRALLSVVPEIAHRQEQRKLLVLLTDGIPADETAAAAAMAEARRAGVEVATLLISANGAPPMNDFRQVLDQFGIPHTTVRVADELAAGMFASVKTAMQAQRI
jgi:cobaltochelatase CobT